MKAALCPEHRERRCLANAGAPNLVRCVHTGRAFEPCRRCGGDGRDPRAPNVLACERCAGGGWARYPLDVGGVYPVK